MAIIAGMADSVRKNGLPVFGRGVICDFAQVQLGTAARDIEKEIKPALHLQKPGFGARVERGEAENLGEEDGRVDAVHLEEVEFDFFCWSLRGAGVVRCDISIFQFSLLSGCTHQPS